MESLVGSHETAPVDISFGVRSWAFHRVCEELRK